MTAGAQFLRPTVACAVLGVSMATLRKWVAEGRLDAIRTPGGHRRIDLQSVTALMLARRAAAAAPAGPVAAGAFDVLLVEDDNVAALHVAALLHEAAPGRVVLRVHDGMQAWRAIERHRPRLVVSDLGMRPMDGFWLTWLLFLDNRLRSIPVLVSTAYTAGDVASRHGLPPQVACLGKPVDPVLFAQLVRQALEG